MKKLNDLFDLVKQSDVTLIGYTFQNERIKDELISNLNYIDVGKIDSSFSLRSFLRNLKLNSILENDSVKNPDYILLDTGNIPRPDNITHSNLGLIKNNDALYGRQQFIKTFVEDLRSQLYTDCSDFPGKPKFKIILTTSLYRSGVNSDGNDINNFSGGSAPLYVSDLVFTISDSKIKVIKNRFGHDGDEILYNTQQQIVEF
jgi:hypothetical protein